MIDWLDVMPGGIIDQEGNVRAPIQVLADFLKLIHDTPHLDWLLLTKRPENWADRLMEADAIIKEEWLWHWRYGNVPLENVWIGVSVEDQKRADERLRSFQTRIRAHSDKDD